MDLCRRVIRQQVSKPRIEQGYLDKLNLPKPIKDYLQYKDRRYIRYILICDVNFDGKIKIIVDLKLKLIEILPHDIFWFDMT